MLTTASHLSLVSPCRPSSVLCIDDGRPLSAFHTFTIADLEHIAESHRLGERSVATPTVIIQAFALGMVYKLSTDTQSMTRTSADRKVFKRGLTDYGQEQRGRRRTLDSPTSMRCGVDVRSPPLCALVVGCCPLVSEGVLQVRGATRMAQ